MSEIKQYESLEEYFKDHPEDEEFFVEALAQQAEHDPIELPEDYVMRCENANR